MLKWKETKIYLIAIFLILMIFNLNYTLWFPSSTIKKEIYSKYPLTASSDSILFDGFTYNWSAFMDNNPSLFYIGQENYSHTGGNIFHCDERMQYQYFPEDYDQRDVNNLTRYFPDSIYWGDDKYDWVWIHRNTTIDTINISIAIIEIGGPEAERFFNVTGEALINLDGTNYQVWVLEDTLGSIANYEKNTGILINGTFIFGGGHTWDIKMTYTSAEFPTNSDTPALGTPQVSPSIGNLTTSFLFTVNYSDADNDLPESINVIINSTSYSMNKQNPLDFNYIDGVTYEYQTFLANGTYNYFFNASDGLYSISTSVFIGPKVYYNNSFSPILSESSVSPLLGYNTSTLFEYNVKYSDFDNNPPLYVNVSINNTIYSMNKKNITDLNYMNGAIYTFETFLSEPGYYVYNFTTSDGENIINLPSSGFYHNPNVTLHNLNGIDIGWITTHGETSNATYSTFLNDAINLGANSEEFNQQIDPYLLYPFEILIIEEGGDSWSDRELAILKNWVENGGSLIIIGDNRDAAQTSISNLFNFQYSEYFGMSGSSTQIFQPHYLTVNVDSINFGTQAATVNLSISNPAINVLINSSDGTPQVCLLELRFGKVLWIIDEIVEDPLILQGDNQIFGQNVLRWMGDKKINDYAPVFSNPSFNPSEGNTTTYFNFSVTYIDNDNKCPIYINVTLNEESYPMVKQDLNDHNYMDGVLYQFITLLQGGTYQYYFNASDGDNEINTLPMAGPNVSYINLEAPSLLAASVTPYLGFGAPASFTFLVTYLDSDNNPPYYVRIYIDGTQYTMTKLDPNDISYQEGVVYQFQTSLDLGEHNYYIEAFDGLYTVKNPPSGAHLGPIVIENDILSEVKIGWIRSHGEYNYSDYSTYINDAITLGATIEEISEVISIDTLRDYNILIVSEGGSSWTEKELDALAVWVSSGRPLFLIGDNRDDSLVDVSLKFQVYYSIYLGSNNYTSDIIQPHTLTNGLNQLYTIPSTSINELTSTSEIVGLIHDVNGELIVATLTYGNGTVTWICDDDILQNIYINEVDNRLFANNTWIWALETVQGGIDRGKDNFLTIIIIISSIVGAGVIIGVVIYTTKLRKSKNLQIIDKVVDEIQDKKSKK